MSLNTQAACAHCGLPVQVPVASDDAVFCCHGCRAAYELIQGAGLGDYYGLRERLGRDEAGAGPVEVAEPGAYAHFDDPEFAAAHGLGPGAAQLCTDAVHCAACVWVIEQLPRVVDGLQEARVNLGTGRIRLHWDPERTSLSEVASSLDRLGYPTRAVDADVDRRSKLQRRAEIVRIAVAGAVAGNVMMLASSLYGGGFGAEEGVRGLFEWVSLALTVPSVLWAAAPFHRRALAGLRVGVLHMDLPISLGLMAGFGASAIATIRGTGEVYFDSVTVLVFLLLLGRWVQHRGQDAALSRAELAQLLVPGTALKHSPDGWQRAASTTLRPGDRVRVAGGERFPADGRVAEGRGHADLSLLTGESRPVPLHEGAPVFAGATLLGDSLDVVVEKVGAQSRVGQLVAAIESADASRAPIVHLADRLGGWFVAAVLVLALAGGLAWWFVDPSRVFDVVVALLVVSCPCALGLATPVALAAARGGAARAGILVRSTEALERAARAKSVVLDKTGTLTEGRHRVGRVILEDPALRRAVAALESRSRHPVGQALARWGAELGPGPLPEPQDFHERVGKGIEGIVEGVRIRVGSPAWIDPGRCAEEVRAVVAEGQTAVVVEAGGRVEGVIGLGDRLQDDAPQGVARLRRLGLQVSVRSGDDPEVVRQVAARLGIEDARGSMTPEDKAEEVRTHGDAVMVGDGVNDALALREAAVGVAVGGGAEAALLVADVYLTRPGVAAVAAFVEGSRRTMGVVRRNLWFSAAYNLCFATLALAGHINPLAAAVLMPISSLTVVVSSILARPFSAGAARDRAVQKMPRRPYTAEGFIG